MPRFARLLVLAAALLSPFIAAYPQSGTFPAQTTVSTSITFGNSQRDRVVLATAGSGGIADVLPDATANTNHMFFVEKVDSAAGSVVINTTSSQTIGPVAGTRSVSLSTQGAYLWVVSDGANWQLIGGGSVTGTNTITAQLSTRVNSALTANHGTFTSGGGGDYWSAAPGYVEPYVVDTWLAMHGCPSCFTTNQIKTWMNLVIADKDGSGNFPIALDHTNSAAKLFYSGSDNLHNFVTGDGNLLIPQYERLYYSLTSSITEFNANAAAIATAIGNVPIDGTTHLVNVAAGTPWDPWGFEDNVKGTGNATLGSLLYYKSAIDLGVLYTAAGNSGAASTWNTNASNVAASLTTSSPLWDTADGMFYGFSIDNKQIDIYASAYAVYLFNQGLSVISSSQATAISTYLVNNYDLLAPKSNGYVLQSPTPWASLWVASVASGAGDQGLWSYGNEWIASALSYTSVSRANQLVTDYLRSASTNLEYYSQTTSGANGATNNLESPMGVYAYALASILPTPNPAVTTTPNGLSDVGASLVVVSPGVIGEGKPSASNTFNGVTAVCTDVPVYNSGLSGVLTAAVSPTTIYTVPMSNGGMYELRYSAKLVTADGASSVLGGTNGFQAIYKSNDNVTVTTPAGTTSALNTGQAEVNGVIVMEIQNAASTVIQYSFGYTSGGGGPAMAYTIRVTLSYVCP